MGASLAKTYFDRADAVARLYLGRLREIWSPLVLSVLGVVLGAVCCVWDGFEHKCEPWFEPGF